MIDSPAERLAKLLDWQQESQTSIDLELKTTTTRLGNNAKTSATFNEIVDHYIETSSGQRSLEFRGLKGGSVVSRSIHYGDHGKFTDINYPVNDGEHQSSIYITNHFWMEDISDRKQIPPPILFFYVGHKPLNRALTIAQYLGPGKSLGRECELFLFKQVRWSITQDQVFYLDKTTSIPLEMHAYRDEMSRERMQPLSVWKAKSLDTVQGYHIPLKSTMSAFDKEGQPTYTWDFDVTRVKFNDEFPPSTFQPVFQPGVTVLDGVTGKSYQTPGAQVAPPAAEPAKTQANLTSQPIQAIPPVGWSGSLGTASLAIGAVLLVAGVSLWWRRR